MLIKSHNNIKIFYETDGIIYAEKYGYVLLKDTFKLPEDSMLHEPDYPYCWVKKDGAVAEVWAGSITEAFFLLEEALTEKEKTDFLFNEKLNKIIE